MQVRPTRPIIVSSRPDVKSGLRCVTGCVRDVELGLANRMRLRKKLQTVFKSSKLVLVEELNGHLLISVFLPVERLKMCDFREMRAFTKELFQLRVPLVTPTPQRLRLIG